MGMRARRSRAAFLSMTITIPTCNQIGLSIERAVRFVAAVAVAFYVAGETCGRAMYRLSDWLVDLTHSPVDTILGLVPTKPKTEPASTPVSMPLTELLGAQVLTDKELEEEIKTYEKKSPRPARRRKPRVTKVEAGV
jgi:hypothetical protein